MLWQYKSLVERVQMLYKRALLTIAIPLLTACQTVPTVNDVTEATTSAIDSVVKTYEETNISEKLASENVKQTAQDILDATQLSNFVQLPGNTKEDELKKKGYLIVSSMGVWRSTQRGRDNMTYPGHTVNYDERLERKVQQRIGSMSPGEIISWEQPYWGALWIHDVQRFSDSTGKQCVNYKIGTPHRYMSLLSAGYGVRTCLNHVTGIFEPEEVRYREILPPSPIQELGPFSIPGERIDTWNS